VGRFLIASAFLSVLAAPGIASADKWRIRGAVESVDGEPVISGYVRVSAPGTVLIRRGVIVAGGFDVEFTTDHRSVTLDVEAPDHERRTAIVELTKAELDLGPLKLRRSDGLTAGALVHHRTAGGKREILDAVVSNSSPSKDVLITKLHLLATKRAHTACFDLVTPAVTFEVLHKVTAKAGTSTQELRIHGATADEVDDSTANVKYEVLPCDQRGLEITIRHDLGLKAGHRDKLRLSLPQVQESTNGPEIAIDLDTWALVALEITDSSGHVARSYLQKKSLP
jgi:hypothetical protein